MLATVATYDPGMARELSTARARLASQAFQIQELNHRIANSLQLAADMLIFEQLRSRDPIAQAALALSAVTKPRTLVADDHDEIATVASA